MAFYSGKQAFVSTAGQGGALLSFSDWSVDMKTGLPKVTNFNSGGQRQSVTGVAEATVTVSGPYDVGNMGSGFSLASGTLCVFTLSIAIGISLVVTAFIESISVKDSTEDTPHLTITAQSTSGPPSLGGGSSTAFTAAIS